MPAIAFDYPEELKAMREGLSVLLRREVFTRHDKYAAVLDDPRKRYDDEGRYAPIVSQLIREVREASAEAGYYSLCAPEAVGGGGLGHLAYFAACERMFHLCGGRYWLGHNIISHWAMGPSPVLTRVTPRLQEAVLPGMLAGGQTMCFCLSEPGAGSDATMIATRARPDGDGWRITGTKIWTSNSPHADQALVFAVTDPDTAGARKGGISAFLIPTDTPGFEVTQIIRMWGSAGGDEAVLVFDDVRAEPHQLVGELGRGFDIAMLGVGLGRIYNAARGVGLGRWALEAAFDYAKTRHAFGHAIADYQGVTFPLADAAMEIHAAHLMSLNAARLLDDGAPARKELSMAKAKAVQAGARAVDCAMQTHGAMGMTNEMHLAEAYIMMRKVNIADGTNEILRRAIAKEMLAGDLDL